MDLTFNSFGEVLVEPQYGHYNCKLTIIGVDEEVIMDQFKPEDLKRLISKIPLKDIIDYHGVEEVIETIGEERVMEHVREYFTKSDEEQ